MAFGNDSSNSYVFVGGLPSWYGGDIAGLENVVLPTVLLEPRFRGAIRNLAYIDARVSDRTALNNPFSVTRQRQLPFQDLIAYKVSVYGTNRMRCYQFFDTFCNIYTITILGSYWLFLCQCLQNTYDANRIIHSLCQCKVLDKIVYPKKGQV